MPQYEERLPPLREGSAALQHAVAPVCCWLVLPQLPELDPGGAAPAVAASDLLHLSSTSPSLKLVWLPSPAKLPSVLCQPVVVASTEEGPAGGPAAVLHSPGLWPPGRVLDRMVLPASARVRLLVRLCMQACRSHRHIVVLGGMKGNVAHRLALLLHGAGAWPCALGLTLGPAAALLMWGRTLQHAHEAAL